MDYCAPLYESLTDATAMQMVTPPTAQGRGPGRPVLRVAGLLRNVIHNNEEYGNLIGYFRSNNMVPPSSENQQPPAGSAANKYFSGFVDPGGVLFLAPPFLFVANDWRLRGRGRVDKRCGPRRSWRLERREIRGRQMECCAICWRNQRRETSRVVEREKREIGGLIRGRECASFPRTRAGPDVNNSTRRFSEMRPV